MLKRVVHRQWQGGSALVFPSGHVAVATATALHRRAGRAARARPRHASGWPSRSLGATYVLLIAVARLVQTVHSLTDLARRRRHRARGGAGRRPGDHRVQPATLTGRSDALSEDLVFVWQPRGEVAARAGRSPRSRRLGRRSDASQPSPPPRPGRATNAVAFPHHGRAAGAGGGWALFLPVPSHSRVKAGATVHGAGGRHRGHCAGDLPAPAGPAVCRAGGAVAISTAADAQRVVAAHPAGTTFVVTGGTHHNNFSVRPKSGDSFCGEPGAVLDGGRHLPTAFSGGATHVTLDSIAVAELQQR